MSTEKRYYLDCHQTAFTSQVVSCQAAAGGWEVALTATCFYPEGGGQACDLGTLGGARVLSVRERGEDVIHLCDAPLEVGRTVEGTIDWPRRFDLMQQHTGEHILSGMIHQKYGYSNVGFHIGKEVMTVDFDGLIPQEELEELEKRANQAVWADLPVRGYYPSPEELEGLTYRSKKRLDWPVRIVEIPGVDRCACCGVHTARTGEVGLIKLLSMVKFHQGVRLELVCGGRAWDHARKIYGQNRQISQALSAKPLETAGAVQAMKEQLAAEKFRAVGLEKRVFQALAAERAGEDPALVFEPGLAPGSVRALAEALLERCPLAVVFSNAAGGHSFCLAGEPDRVRALGGAMSRALGARGGGKAGFFQGNVPKTEGEIRAFFAEMEKN